MQILNCGIASLDKLKTIKKVSAYSLIQMAKENGVNLLIYHVDNKDLMRVPRPTILHAKNHFIYVKNGEPLPNQEYTGFVLSEKGFSGSRIVSYGEAKQITGEKKARQILGPIVQVVGAVVGSIIGGPAGALMGAESALAGKALSTGGHVGKPLDIASTLATGAFSTGFGGKAAPFLTGASAATPKVAKGNL